MDGMEKLKEITEIFCNKHGLENKLKGEWFEKIMDANGSPCDQLTIDSAELRQIKENDCSLISKSKKIGITYIKRKK